MKMPQPQSQCARVLAALSDGQWRSVPAIHRAAGTMRLNSRVAELRSRYGCNIECKRVPNRKGAAAYRYRWIDAPKPLGDPEPEPLFTWDELAPRRPEEKYRLYRKMAGKDIELVATCGTPEAVGVALVTLADDGEWDKASVGVLDIDGGKNGSGHWVVSPFETGTW